MQLLECVLRHVGFCIPLPQHPACPWDLGSLAQVRNSPEQEALLSKGRVDVDEKQSCSGCKGGRGGLKTCPMDGVADGSLHPVPRGNTFESFVVAPRAVQLAAQGVYSRGRAESSLALHGRANTTLFILGFPISSV